MSEGFDDFAVGINSQDFKGYMDSPDNDPPIFLTTMAKTTTVAPPTPPGRGPVAFAPGQAHSPAARIRTPPTPQDVSTTSTTSATASGSRSRSGERMGIPIGPGSGSEYGRGPTPRSLFGGQGSSSALGSALGSASVSASGSFSPESPLVGVSHPMPGGMDLISISSESAPNPTPVSVPVAPSGALKRKRGQLEKEDAMQHSEDEVREIPAPKRRKVMGVNSQKKGHIGQIGVVAGGDLMPGGVGGIQSEKIEGDRQLALYRHRKKKKKTIQFARLTQPENLSLENENEDDEDGEDSVLSVVQRRKMKNAGLGPPEGSVLQLGETFDPLSFRDVEVLEKRKEKRRSNFLRKKSKSPAAVASRKRCDMPSPSYSSSEFSDSASSSDTEEEEKAKNGDLETEAHHRRAVSDASDSDSDFRESSRPTSPFFVPPQKKGARSRRRRSSSSSSSSSSESESPAKRKVKKPKRIRHQRKKIPNPPVRRSNRRRRQTQTFSQLASAPIPSFVPRDSASEDDSPSSPPKKMSMSRQFRLLCQKVKSKVRKGKKVPSPVREEKVRVIEKMRQEAASPDFLGEESGFESDDVEMNERRIAQVFNVGGVPIQFILSGRFPPGRKAVLFDTLHLNGGRVVKVDSVSRYPDQNTMIIAADGPRKSFSFLLALVLDLPIVSVEWIEECVQENRLVLPVKERYLVRKTAELDVVSRCVDSTEDLQRACVPFDGFDGKRFALCRSILEDGSDVAAYRALLRLSGATIHKKDQPLDFLLSLSTVDAGMLATAQRRGYRVVTKQFLIHWWAARNRPPWSLVFRRKLEWLGQPTFRDGSNWYDAVQIGEQTFDVGTVVELRDDLLPDGVHSGPRFGVIVSLFESVVGGKKLFDYSALPRAMNVGVENARENELVLNSLHSRHPLEHILREVKLHPFICPPSEGLFCRYKAVLHGVNVVGTPQLIGENFPWRFQWKSLEMTWFQTSPDDVKGMTCYSFAVVGGLQFFVSQWVYVKVVYEGELLDFRGKIVEMADHPDHGRIFMLRLVKPTHNPGTLGKYELGNKEIKIILDHVYQIVPMRFSWSDGALQDRFADDVVSTVGIDSFNIPFKDDKDSDSDF